MSMQDPVTEVDERFSDAGAEPTPWATTRAVLEQAQLSWVTTVRADGRPHVTPLVAVWLDDSVHFTTGPSEQKAVNLAGNPHVVMTTGCNRWDEGLDVMVEGKAERVTAVEAVHHIRQGGSAAVMEVGSGEAYSTQARHLYAASQRDAQLHAYGPGREISRLRLLP